MIKRLKTDGICYIERLKGTQEWYWGSDYAAGDLYEAEEVFREGKTFRTNRVLFIKYPEGEVIEPVRTQENQYLGLPVFSDGKIISLLVDFAQGEIRLLSYDPATKVVAIQAVIPLGAVKDCYNLRLETQPLMLIRHGMEDRFELLWPEQAGFDVGENEAFLFRDGDRLYFQEWFEDENDYHEEVVVRKLPDGKELERMPGSYRELPDGQKWLLV